MCDLNDRFLQTWPEKGRTVIFNQVPAKYQTGDGEGQKNDQNSLFFVLSANGNLLLKEKRVFASIRQTPFLEGIYIGTYEKLHQVYSNLGISYPSETFFG